MTNALNHPDGSCNQEYIMRDGLSLSTLGYRRKNILGAMEGDAPRK